MYGFCNVCVGFVMSGFFNVWVCVSVDFVMIGFCNVWVVYVWVL